MKVLACLIVLVACVAGTIHYQETFDASWEDRWVVSSWKQSDGTAGKWVHTAGEFYGDAEADKGIQTSQDARFYAISSKAESSFSNEGKDLVLQFQVRHPQNIDCGGGYIKILPSGLDQENFDGSSDYSVMFGPDVCGSTKRIHAIFNYKGDNKLITRTVMPETDRVSHVYTLYVKANGEFEIRLDGEVKESGKLTEAWEFLPPAKINDPEVSKPSDWVDDAMIDDPEDEKPEDWDQPKMIEDPEAEKPEDWDDDADGEWEAPMIDNPDYKGTWSPKRIANPDYKGAWVHPQIDNPEYDASEEANVARYSNMEYVGFELWQVKAGSIFDNIIVTDSIEEAEKFMADTFNKEAEREALNKQEAEKRAAEEAARADDEEEYSDEEYDEEDYEDEDLHDEL